jgi:hypothetical protein
MILDRKNVAHGAIPVGKVMSLETTYKTTSYNTTSPTPGLEWGTLAAGTDGYVLTCSAAAAAGVAWAAPYSYTLPAALTGTTLVVTGGIATNGVTTPPAKAAYPGLATGTDAVMVNAITAILVALGFCAAS